MNLKPEDFKECKKCLSIHHIENYHINQSICKQCRKTTDKQRHDNISKENFNKLIKERIPIRNEFIRKRIEHDKKIDIKVFIKLFIPLEKYKEMKNQPDK